MAKKKSAKAAKSAKKVVSSLAAKGYLKCSIGTCRREMKDLKAHIAAHKAGQIGDDGKRTDRSKVEALAWARRFNGTEATELFRDVPAEKRVKMKV